MKTRSSKNKKDDLEMPIRFFEWSRFNLSHYAEKLEQNDRKEFELGKIPSKLYEIVLKEWSKHLRTCLPWHEKFFTWKLALPDSRDLDRVMNCSLHLLAKLPKRIRNVLAKAEKLRTKEIDDDFFLNGGKAQVAEYLKISQSQSIAHRKLIILARGYKCKENGGASLGETQIDVEQMMLSEAGATGSARSGTAASFTRENLPVSMLKQHGHLSGYPAGISRLLEDTQVVLDGIRATIGGSMKIPRRELLGQLCQLIENNPLVFLTGEAGSGKSVLAKLGFPLVAAGATGFAFRAESLAGTHINEVLARFGLTLAGLCAQTAAHGRKILWIESIERLMEKTAEERAAFLDLLRAIKNDPTWRVLITCRDYSAETVRTAFFGEVGIPCAELFVPELNDEELKVPRCFRWNQNWGKRSLPAVK